MSILSNSVALFQEIFHCTIKLLNNLTPRFNNNLFKLFRCQYLIKMAIIQKEIIF